MGGLVGDAPMTKLEPSEAQRKALVDKLSEHVQWHRDGVEMAVDEMIAAANSIPEGAPVGTIARRPDGAWKAERKAGEAGPYWQYSTSAFWQADSPDWNSEDDADSWPVIYDPTGKTLDELHAEIDRLDKAEDSALRERDYWEETVNRILYTCSSVNEIGEWSSANDPVERFIEQFRPVKRIDPTNHPSREELRGYFHKDLAEHCQADDPDEPRTPRVVDRLGVDERSFEWTRRYTSRDLYIYEYRYRGGVWRFRLLGHEHWTALEPGYEPTNGPFTEVLDVV